VSPPRIVPNSRWVSKANKNPLPRRRPQPIKAGWPGPNVPIRSGRANASKKPSIDVVLNGAPNQHQHANVMQLSMEPLLAPTAPGPNCVQLGPGHPQPNVRCGENVPCGTLI